MKLNNIILLIILIASCKAPQPTVSTITICDDIAGAKYIKECKEYLGKDSTNIRYIENCQKEAHTIYCKQVKVVTIKGKQYPCEGEYKKYCK